MATDKNNVTMVALDLRLKKRKNFSLTAFPWYHSCILLLFIKNSRLILSIKIFSILNYYARPMCNSVHKQCFTSTRVRIRSHIHFMFVVIKYAFHSPALLYTVWNTTTEQQTNKNDLKKKKRRRKKKKKTRVKTWWVNTTRYFAFQHFSGFLSAGILLIYELFISYLIVYSSSQCIHVCDMRAYLPRNLLILLFFIVIYSIYFVREVFRSLHSVDDPFPALPLPLTQSRVCSWLGHMFCLFTLPIFVTVRKQ